MFKYYRQEGCFYECRIKYASQLAGCIPWDYPTTIDMNDTKICTRGTRGGQGSLEVFEEHMQNDSVLEKCNCEPNCEEVAFHTEVKQSCRLSHLFGKKITWILNFKLYFVVRNYDNDRILNLIST